MLTNAMPEDRPDLQKRSVNPELTHLLYVATTVLRQAVDLTTQALVSDDQLSRPSHYIPGSTIGKHLRHARDHFNLLLESVEGEKPHVLSYDVRVRNTPMETSLRTAHDCLNDTIRTLERVVPSVDLNEPITLNAVTPFPQTLQTTFGRELWFSALHTVHHWAMVRVITGELNIKLPDDFGFAPSTLVHRGTEAPLGKAKI